jgi:hypothetical protein
MKREAKISAIAGAVLGTLGIAAYISAETRPVCCEQPPHRVRAPAIIDRFRWPSWRFRRRIRQDATPTRFTCRYRSCVPLCVWTIGHSTRSSDEFRGVLATHGIELLADVRRFPGSRRLPHFAADVLARDLANSHIYYQWIPALGGRRRSNERSINTGWRHSAFRAYADHAATEEFAGGLNDLLMLAYGLRTAIMCAEVLWWRCHRRIIADILTSLGVEVLHLRDDGPGEVHRLAPPARLVHGTLTYLPLHPTK